MPMSVELFPVDPRPFEGGPEFRDWLASYYDPDAADNDLTILAGITRQSREGILASLQEDGFRIEDRLGEVLKVAKSQGDEEVESYLTIDDPGVLLFYSNQRKTEDLPLIEEFLEREEDTYALFISPHTIRETLDEMMVTHDDLKVIEFTARRQARSSISAERREYEDRTISYWGDDGLQTLEEMQHEYGVLPDRVVIEVPWETKVGIDRRGLFTYMRGDFEVVLGPLQQALERAAHTIEAFENSAFQLLPVETERQSFEIPSSRPVKIQLQNELSYVEASDFQEKLEDREYLTMNFAAEEGSLFLNSDVLTEEGDRFRIKASEDTIRVLPVDQHDFSVFMAFYEFVVDEVDPEAELRV